MGSLPPGQSTSPPDLQSSDDGFRVVGFVTIGLGGSGLTLTLDTSGLRPRFSTATSANLVPESRVLLTASRVFVIVSSCGSTAGRFSPIRKLYVHVAAVSGEIQ